LHISNIKDMKFKAEIDVMPLDALLDPQGKAVTNSMKNIGLPEIEGVRIGKHIRLFVEAENSAEAEQKVETACKKMLANQIMESYHFELSEA
jgi:phosphoribosylformylglycinamidine synthase PurS subunit